MFERQMFRGFAVAQPDLELGLVGAQAVQSHNLCQPAFHPSPSFIVAVLCPMTDLQRPLEGRIAILTQKDMDGLFPSAQPFLAVHHHGPTNLSVIPLLAVHTLPPFLASVLRNR